MSWDIIFKGFTDPILQTFREVWQEDNSLSSFVDQTANAAFRNTVSGQFVPFPATESSPDACYFGYERPFGKITLGNDGGTAGTLGVVTWQYWNGSIWASHTGVTDGTTNFRAGPSHGQDVTYDIPTDWARTTVNGGASLYFTRARVDTVWTVNPIYDYAVPSDIGASLDPIEVWQEDADGGPSYVSMLTEATDASAGDVDPWPAVEATGDAFYIGLRQEFGGIRVDYAGGTTGVGGATTYEYWDSSTWSALTVTDPTTDFTATASDDNEITWTVPGDWAKTTVNSGESLYFIRIRPSTTYSTNPVLDQLWCIRSNLLLTPSFHAINNTGEGLMTAPSGGVFSDFGYQFLAAADGYELTEVVVPVACTLEDVISDEQHAGAVAYEVVQNGAVDTTHTSGSGSGDSRTGGLSSSFAAGDTISVRSVLSGGANPGWVSVILRFSHTVTVPGLAQPAAPTTASATVEAINLAAMHFGSTGTTTARYLRANGQGGSSEQVAKDDMTKLRCPITGEIDTVLLNSFGTGGDITFWINNTEQVNDRLRHYQLGGNSYDHQCVFRDVGIPVTVGDILEVERTAGSAGNVCTVLIKPTTEESGHQYWFGGDMQTASRAMLYMGEADDAEATIGAINTGGTVLYDGAITRVVLRRQIAGTSYRIRVNGITQGEVFSDDGVTNFSVPIPVSTADVIQVVTTAGAGAQNRSTCGVHVVPTDAGRTGIILPYGGDSVGGFTNNNYARNALASDATSATDDHVKVVFSRDVRVLRIGGFCAGGSDLRVVAQSYTEARRVTAAGANQIARVEEVAPTEGGLLVERHRFLTFAVYDDRGDSSFNVYVE